MLKHGYYIDFIGKKSAWGPTILIIQRFGQFLIRYRYLFFEKIINGIKFGRTCF